jgi:hypothetical protein
MWWNQACSFVFPWNVSTSSGMVHGPSSKLLGICCASSPGLELTFVATLGRRLRRSDNLRASARMDHSLTGCPIWAGEQSKMSLLEPKGEEAIRLKDPTSQCWVTFPRWGPNLRGPYLVPSAQNSCTLYLFEDTICLFNIAMGKSLINGGFIAGKIIYKWAMFHGYVK